MLYNHIEEIWGRVLSGVDHVYCNDVKQGGTAQALGQLTLADGDGAFGLLIFLIANLTKWRGNEISSGIEAYQIDVIGVGQIGVGLI